MIRNINQNLKERIEAIKAMIEHVDSGIFDSVADMEAVVNALGYMPGGGLVEGVDYEIEDSEIETAVRKIADAGCGIIFADHGQGSAGPKNVESDELLELLDDGFFADFTEADCAEECMDARTNFELLFPGSLFGDESDYWQASATKGDGDNPLTVTILLYNP
jgi:hypothetical protein